MKRVVFDRPGTPAEVLHMEDDVPAPQPARGEVLVRDESGGDTREFRAGPHDSYAEPGQQAIDDPADGAPG